MNYADKITCLTEDRAVCLGMAFVVHRFCFTRCLERRDGCYCDFIDIFQCGENPDNDIRAVGPSPEQVIQEKGQEIFNRLTEICLKRKRNCQGDE